jgi:cation diffusion facilitator CzcD-associated flavoprotein CzcO
MCVSSVAIIGAGPAGISAALALKDVGVAPLLLDHADQVAASWRTQYHRLKLNTGRQFSHLPGRPFPKGTPPYPSRDQVVDHFDRHAREDGIDLRLGITVQRVDWLPTGWRLTTSNGELHTRQLVVATGYQHTPQLPRWPGSFTGEVLHSCHYRNPMPYRNARVLVVGSGSSGMEIAHDLSTGGAARVWLSVRTPPSIMPRAGPAGLPNDVVSIPLYRLPARLSDRIAVTARRKVFGDLSRYGLPPPEEGPFTRAHRLHVAPTVVGLEVIGAIRDGSIEVVAGVSALEGPMSYWPTERAFNLMW